MQEERLKILLQYLEEEPNEPFNIYSVAMEYMNTNPGKALGYLEKLLAVHPDYVPTYYHAAALYFELEEFEKADEVYKKGIEIAHQKQNKKAFDELNRAYRMFLDEIE
ncbi:tetratricopeptide repeat protein [Emticicia sp. TH156]|uniref:tetratricopeptide repeat protein n=1 Tax=Emticicia sp. TH156 TaxID=2067454 RepID=UPI000C77F752|nr:tetratricopeptide repeat protein [Emticicia sp. TH156]PLK43766.1 enzyme of heme biosynthesis [Emticicia sp. TH156]